jgi:hypothetical protein
LEGGSLDATAVAQNLADHFLAVAREALAAESESDIGFLWDWMSTDWGDWCRFPCLVEALCWTLTQEKFALKVGGWFVEEIRAVYHGRLNPSARAQILAAITPQSALYDDCENLHYFVEELIDSDPSEALFDYFAHLTRDSEPLERSLGARYLARLSLSSYATANMRNRARILVDDMFAASDPPMRAYLAKLVAWRDALQPRSRRCAPDDPPRLSLV